jgi:hypothetical protein
MFLDLPDTDPLVRGADQDPAPDPELEPDPDPLFRGTDPGIQIRIRTQVQVVFDFRSCRRRRSAGPFASLTFRQRESQKRTGQVVIMLPILRSELVSEDTNNAGIFEQFTGARNRVGIGCRTGPPGYLHPNKFPSPAAFIC